MHKKWAGVTHAYLAPQKTVAQLTLFWNARLLTTGLRSFPSWKILMTVIVAFDNGLVRSQCDQRDYHAFTCIIRKKQTLNLPLSNHILDEIEYLECRPQGISKLKV